MRRKLDMARLALFVGTGLAVSTAAFGLISPPPGQAQAQAGTAVPQAQAAAPQSFEVASIKPSAADSRFMKMGITPGGRYEASGVTVKLLIQQAYDVRDYQISGGPSWISTERYDIVAKAETPEISREQMRILLQSLLAERFNLKIRRETKELPIYSLVVGKSGPKLKASEVQPGTGTDATQPNTSKSGDPGAGPVIRLGGAGGSASGTGGGATGARSVSVAVERDGSGTVPKGASMMRMGPGQLSAQGAPISLLVSSLAQQLGRPVVDNTGLKGNFDFALEWTPDETQRNMLSGAVGKPDSPLPADSSGPSIFTAVQEQLGLKLEAGKGPVETLVIERVEKPSGN